MKIFINDVAVKRNSGGVYTVIQSVYSSEVKMNDDHFTFLGADVKIMDRFFQHRKVPLPRNIFKTRISA